MTAQPGRSSPARRARRSPSTTRPTLTAAGLLAPEDPSARVHGHPGHKDRRYPAGEQRHCRHRHQRRGTATPRVACSPQAWPAIARPISWMTRQSPSPSGIRPTRSGRRRRPGATVPEAIGWNHDGTLLFTADEVEEASREAAAGAYVMSSAAASPTMAVARAHRRTSCPYPDGQSNAKASRPRGCGGDARRREFRFVTSERGAFVAVYRLQGRPRHLRAAAADGSGAGKRPHDSVAQSLVTGRTKVMTAKATISLFRGMDKQWEPPPARVHESRRRA